MSNQSSYFKLGLFVVISVALLVAGVIVLGAGKLLERKITIETYMDHSVNGLTKGADAKYKGVQIGTVSVIGFATLKYEPDFMSESKELGGTVLVEIALDPESLGNPTDRQFLEWLNRAVESGLRVRMASSGLTGPAYVEFVYLDPEKFPAPQVSWTPPSLYVPAAPSEMRVLMDAVEEVVAGFRKIDFKQLSNDVHSLLTNADQKLSELEMGELNDEALALLREARAKVEDIDMEQINESAVSLLEEVRGSNARLKEILDNPNIDPSIADLRATLDNARAATERIREILDDPRVQEIIEQVAEASGEVKPAIEDVRRLVRRIDRLLASQQATIEGALQELARAVENINALTEDAQANPSRVLFGDPPPKESHGDNQ